MTVLTAIRPTRLLGALRTLALGALLSLNPVTALVSLGWLTRQMGWIARDRFGALDEPPGWILGPREAAGRETGRLTRALGGLAANIRAGVITAMALFAWTLPFAALWLGAWWAGWENSFNKGYEQAPVGALTFLLGAAIAALVLPVLPLTLAHMAAEDRLSAAFELRRLKGIAAQSGWRLPALGVATALAALPLMVARVMITVAHEFIPWVEDLTPPEAEALQGQIALGLAAYAFVELLVLRGMAAKVYAQAAPRAAALRPGLWDGSQAAEAAQPARPARGLPVWYLLASAASLVFAFEILVGQFFDHAWWRWLFHPLFALPWPG